MQRTPIPESMRTIVFERHGVSCAYCGEAATAIDHVIPYSYVMRHEVENLVPVCNECNLIASDKMFDSFEHKKEYILQIRSSDKWHGRLEMLYCHCADCGVSFTPHVEGATNLLCRICAGIAGLPSEQQEEARSKRKLEVKMAMEEVESLMESSTASLLTETNEEIIQQLTDDEKADIAHKNRMRKLHAEKAAAMQRLKDKENKRKREAEERALKRSQKKEKSINADVSGQPVIPHIRITLIKEGWHIVKRTLTLDDGTVENEDFAVVPPMCPFCLHHIDDVEFDGDCWNLVCDDCGAAFSMPYGEDEYDEMLGHWNRGTF